MLLLTDPWSNSSVQHIHLYHPPLPSVNSPKTPVQTALIPLSLSSGKLGVLVICLDIIYNEIFHHLKYKQQIWDGISWYVFRKRWWAVAMDQTAGGFVDWETLLVSSISSLAISFCTSSLVYPYRISWDSLETCFLPPGCHKYQQKIILWEYYFSIPLMTSYGLMLTYV